MKNPESKRFVVIEDLLEWQGGIKQALGELGHVVVARAMNLQEALELVKKFKKLEVDAVTLDGNLREEVPEGYQPGDDAKDILEALKKEAPKVKVIGMSIDEVDGADINIHKPSHFRLKAQLEYAISELFAKKS